MTADARQKSKCNAVSGSLRCDREVGHVGSHRGYNEQIDEAMFWSDVQGDLLAFICATVNAVGDMISKTEAIDAIEREWKRAGLEVR